MTDHRRRSFLRAASWAGLAALAPALRADPPDAVALPTDDLCVAGGVHAPLFIPGNRGLFGRLSPSGESLKLRMQRVAPTPTAPWPLAFVAQHRGKTYGNPTLLFKTGDRVRIELSNRLPDPSVVHWHGLTVDSRNDGAGSALISAGDTYSYDFEVRNRAGLYWYHPHPHGLSGAQTYAGLFGMIEVEDAEEAALRSALDLIPAATEIPLLLQDRRGDEVYNPTGADAMHGFVGNQVLVNGSRCPYLDVATRVYRFRVVNASNARNYCLAARTASGKRLPLIVIGTDGGLLAAPSSAPAVFVGASERVDVLLDLAGVELGDSVLLESLGFDPMHMEMPGMASMPASQPVDHAAMGHAAGSGNVDARQATAAPAPSAASAIGHDGTQALLLELRVKQRAVTNKPIPSRLSTLPVVNFDGAKERSFRLGFSKGRWRINDQVFVMGETPIQVSRGTVETWLIRNYHTSMPHPMHLHGFQFRVIERQTSPDQVASLKVDDRGRTATDLGLKDTVLVWPGESVRIGIDFSLPFPGPQDYMFHCHNLEHEDGGMMLGVRVA